jgi:hypothetical protein
MKTRLIPGAPRLKIPKVISSEPDTELYFSYARHAMIKFLDFIRIVENSFHVRLIAPNYMCHEVINAISPRVTSVDYYDVTVDFEVNFETLLALIDSDKLNVVLVSHLYGRLFPQTMIADLEGRHRVYVIEDSAHLPRFYLSEMPIRSSIRVFTYRKLFGVPHGATCALREGLDEPFKNYYRNTGESFSHYWTNLQEIRWIIREVVKSLLIIFRINPLGRRYKELGSDPLNSITSLSLCVRQLIRHQDLSNFIERRRSNYVALKEIFDSQSSGWRYVKFDLSKDIPYQFVVYKDEPFESVGIINDFLSFGISVVKGLELPRTVREKLGHSHPFNNQICFPLHQDLDDADIAYLKFGINEVLFKSLRPRLNY